MGNYGYSIYLIILMLSQRYYTNNLPDIEEIIDVKMYHNLNIILAQIDYVKKAMSVIPVQQKLHPNYCDWQNQIK